MSLNLLVSLSSLASRSRLFSLASQVPLCRHRSLPAVGTDRCHRRHRSLPSSLPAVGTDRCLARCLPSAPIVAFLVACRRYRSLPSSLPAVATDRCLPSTPIVAFLVACRRYRCKILTSSGTIIRPWSPRQQSKRLVDGNQPRSPVEQRTLVENYKITVKCSFRNKSTTE